jgi:hypothetical protein
MDKRINLKNNKIFNFNELIELIDNFKLEKTIENNFQEFKEIIINYLNQFIAILTDDNITNDITYLLKSLDENNKIKIQYLNEKQIKSKFKNYNFKYKPKKNEIKFLNIFKDIWNNSINRLKYLGIKYDPIEYYKLQEEKNFNYFNLYNGLKFTEEECKIAFQNKSEEEKKLFKLILDHLFKIISNSNKEIYEYLIKWLGTCLKYPGIKLHTILVIIGMEGSGKGIFFNKFLELFENNSAYVSSFDHVIGRFNSLLKNKIFMYMDEIIIGKNIKEYSQFKSLITEDKFISEEKFKNKKEIPNYLNFIITSNNRKFLFFNSDSNKSRRFVFIESSNEFAKENNKEYFNNLSNALNNKNVLKLLHYFLINKFKNEIEINKLNNKSEFNFGTNFPLSQLNNLNSISRLNSVEYWIYECLERGYHLRQLELTNKNLNEYLEINNKLSKIGRRIDEDGNFLENWICLINKKKLFKKYLLDIKTISGDFKILKEENEFFDILYNLFNLNSQEFFNLNYIILPEFLNCLEEFKKSKNIIIKNSEQNFKNLINIKNIKNLKIKENKKVKEIKKIKKVKEIKENNLNENNEIIINNDKFFEKEIINNNNNSNSIRKIKNYKFHDLNSNFNKRKLDNIEINNNNNNNNLENNNNNNNKKIKLNNEIELIENLNFNNEIEENNNFDFNYINYFNNNNDNDYIIDCLFEENKEIIEYKEIEKK